MATADELTAEIVSGLEKLVATPAEVDAVCVSAGPFYAQFGRPSYEQPRTVPFEAVSDGYLGALPEPLQLTPEQRSSLAALGFAPPEVTAEQADSGEHGDASPNWHQRFDPEHISLESVASVAVRVLTAVYGVPVEDAVVNIVDAEPEPDQMDKFTQFLVSDGAAEVLEDFANDTLYTTDGLLSDGRHYTAEVWQLDPAFHLTIFIPPAGESTEDLIAQVERELVTFRGQRYVRCELTDRPAGPTWSFNAVACDAEHQYLSRMPLPAGVDTYSIVPSGADHPWTFVPPTGEFVEAEEVVAETAATLYASGRVFSDGRPFTGRLWQDGIAYYVTIFTPAAGLSEEDLIAQIERELVTFCGERFIQCELTDRPAGPTWSFTALACDAEHQYVSRMPLRAGVDTHAILSSDDEILWTFEASTA